MGFKFSSHRKGISSLERRLINRLQPVRGWFVEFIKFDKEEGFPGKAALEIERQRGSKKRFVSLIVEAGKCDAPYMSTLWKNDQIVGETTSGAWGYRTNSSIALGMIRSDLASAGTLK